MVIGALALILCSLAVATASGFDSDSDLRRAGVTVLEPVAPGKGATVIHVSGDTITRPLAPGFVGLSLEYSTLEPYAGTRPSAIDPVLVNLIRGLAPGQRPVLRFGGDSTDWTWWPVPGMPAPLGIRIVIGPRFGSVLRGLARAVDGRLILGINLEADSRRIAALEADRLVHSVGASRVQALELGNEPELYGTWPWRILPSGRRVIGRPPDYGMASYVRNFRSIASALPPLALAGPALGGPMWISRVGEFIAGERRLGVVTLHTYPLQACDTPLVKPTYPTIPHLLASRSAQGLAGGLKGAVRIARARGLPLRVDEINSAACGGADGVSDTFASALWALDTTFAMARAGVDGVNIHTFRGADYALFGLQRHAGRWTGTVAPEYYGLSMFARAAPAGSRLVKTTGGAPALRVWSTVARNGATRIVLINEAAHARVVVVHAPERAPLAGYQALRAPGLRATANVSLGGASFGSATATGRLPAARRIMVRAARGAYVLRLPAASAAMLTVPDRDATAAAG